MGNFNKGKRDGGGRGGNRFSDVQREMHSATCAKCGNRCEVPFKPTGDKPVYCSDCFSNSRDGGRHDFTRGAHNPSKERPGTRNDNNQLKSQFEKLNYKLDKILTMLSLGTTPAKPHNTESRNTKDREVYKKEVDTDALKMALTTLSTKKEVKKTTPKKTMSKKPVKKKAASKKTTKKKSLPKKATAKKASTKKR